MGGWWLMGGGWLMGGWWLIGDWWLMNVVCTNIGIYDVR